MKVHTLEVKTGAKEQFINITAQVRELLAKAGISQGLCHVYIPHTTAGVTINEGADPDVVTDVLVHFRSLVPDQGPYKHLEGNSPAHIKAILVGTEKTIPVVDSQLRLGTWQRIFFCEFDGPRHRKVHLTFI